MFQNAISYLEMIRLTVDMSMPSIVNVFIIVTIKWVLFLPEKFFPVSLTYLLKYRQIATFAELSSKFISNKET